MQLKRFVNIASFVYNNVNNKAPGSVVGNGQVELTTDIEHLGCEETYAGKPLVGDRTQDPSDVFSISFSPQSSSVDTVMADNSPDVTSVAVDAARTTAFVENTKIVKSGWNGSTGSDKLEVKFNSIRDFLGKPYLVASQTWNNTDAINTVLYTANLGSYLTTVSAWANKVIGFNLVRGTFKIRVEVIANRFQQGMLVLHYLPNQASFDSSYALMHNATMNGVLQQPHVLINASDSAAEITVPYISPTSYYSLNDGTIDWATVYLRVLSSLNSGTSGENFCRINVYAWIEDVELTAPFVPQSAQEDVPGPISTGLMHISNAASSFAQLPGLRSVFDSVSWAARMASGVASVFGWSKPTTELQPQVVTRSNWRYNATSTGADNSIPLGLIHDNSLDIKKFSIRDVDEMSTKFLYSIPNYMGHHVWNTTDLPNTTLWSTPVGPNYLGIQGTSVHGGHTTTYVQGAPVVYLSQFFNFWRGSFRIKIKIIKTEMHKGKLQVTWTPNQTSINGPDQFTSIYALRHIIDIAEKDTFILTLPYMINTDYLNVQNDGTNVSNYSGRVDIKVLNELRAPETCASNVDVLFWVEPGDDFEYAGPGRSVYPSPTPVPFVPQSSIEDVSDMVIEGGIGGASIENLTITPSLQSMGEHFTSIKQLLNRFSQVGLRISTTANFGNGVTVWPYFTGETTMDTTSGALTQAAGSGDMMGIFMPWFAYFRGGVRISVSPNQDASTTLYTLPSNVSVSLTPQSYGTASDGNTVITPYTSGVVGIRTGINTNASVMNVGASYTETDYGLGLVSARVPYYSRTPIALTASAQTLARKTAIDSSKSVVNFVANTTAGSSLNRITLYRSCCDDFQFNFFVGAPPFIIGYS